MNPIPAPSGPSAPPLGARTGTSIAALVLLFAFAVCCIAPAAAVDPPPGEQYTFIDQWGVTLSWPRGIAVSGAGEVYVADSNNHRICRNSSAGVRFFGSSANLQFNQPSGVAVDAAGNVYVADTGNGRVLKFDPTGIPLAQFGTDGPGKLSKPRGVDLDRDGNVYVSDVALHRVVEFDRNGIFLRMWGKTDGTLGINPGEFAAPYGLAADDAGALYVADTNNHRVQKFAPGIETPTVYTNPSGAPDGGFSSPVDVAVDRDGNVYVVESVGNRVQKLSASGAFLTGWSMAGTGYGQFQNPQGVTVDPAGKVYVTQNGLAPSPGRVQVFVAPLRAAFAPSSRSGPAPLEVRFTDASTGAPTGWAWDFGDGETADVPAPVHTFQAPGLYAVTLTVTRPGASATASATIEVTDPSPVAAPDSFELDEDGILSVPAPGVLLNDADPDGDPLTATPGDGPLHGTVALAPGGGFTYTPSRDFSGADSFTYTASDGAHRSEPATVGITVAPVDDPPVPADDAFSTAEDTPLAVAAPGVLSNDPDPDGGPSPAAALSAGPAHGTATMNPDGAFAYTPGADFCGTDSFTYTVEGATAPATVTIAVSPVNDVPVAGPVSVATDEDTAVAVLLAGTDADGDALTAAVVTGPVHGTLSGTAPDLSYLPASDYAGPDGFSFTVSDGQATSAPAMVTVTVSPVNDAPAIVSPLAVPLDPGPVSAPVAASATFADADPGDTHTATWDWGDGTGSAGMFDGRTVLGSHAYAAAGVYTIRLALTDAQAGVTATAPQYTVVYDPDGGFVTGGGWIRSPAGAYVPDPALAGKATFGFVSKYRKGATVPTGETEFQFHAAGMDFRSSSYDWLVVAGTKAMYKGVGTLDGAGEYGFMLSAIDGGLARPAVPDTLRIRIWDRATEAVVYDNQPGGADEADPTTALGGGSIVVHKG